MPSHPDRVRANQPEVNAPLPCTFTLAEVRRIVDTETRRLVAERLTPWEYALRVRTMAEWNAYHLLYGRWYGPVALVTVDEAGQQSSLGLKPDRRACPQCSGPSLSGGLCHGCVYSASTAETPWGV